MKYLILMSSTWLLSFSLFSQSHNNVIIRDSITKLAVPYASIRFIKSKKGSYTNDNGYFNLSLNLDDTLFISSIGYTNKIIAEKNIHDTAIFLQPKIDTLSNVTVTSRKPIGEIKLGILKAAKTIVWTSGGFGDEFAQKITFPHSDRLYKLKKIQIAAERFDRTIPILLHIYQSDKNGFPGNDLLFNKILLKKEHFKKKQKEFEIDIQDENIYISEGACFIGFEWLPVDEKGTKLPSSGLILTQDINERLTYSKAFFWNNNKWTATPSLPSQKKPTNTIISVLVDIFE